MSPTGRFQGLLGGLAIPRAAFSFLWSHKRLWPLVVMPLLINLALFAAVFWFSYTRFDQWVRGLIPAAEAWYWSALLYLLIVLVVALLLLVELYLFTMVGNLLACPFLEILTRRVEMAVAGGVPGGPGGAGAMLREILRVGLLQVRKLLLYLVVLAVLLVINLAPGLGALAYAVLAWLVTCFFLVLEFLDYSLDRRGLNLRQKLAYVWRLRLTGLGFGAALFVMGMIPVLNLALLPVGAVGATLLYLERSPAGPAAPPARR